jgi:hypothetical protein
MIFKVGDMVTVKPFLNEDNYQSYTEEGHYSPGWNGYMTRQAMKNHPKMITDIKEIYNTIYYIIEGYSYLAEWFVECEEDKIDQETDKINRLHPKWKIIQKIRKLDKKFKERDTHAEPF